MKNYYELLNLQPKATSGEIHAMFRRYIARYRQTVTVDQLVSDMRFIDGVNAYLTLQGPLRSQYDATLKTAQHTQAVSDTAPDPPRPFLHLSQTERDLFISRLAYWRREYSDAIHLLRGILEREHNNDQAWALLGEIYFSIDHIDEGIRAYRNAVQANPHVPRYTERLQQARDADAGKCVLRIEPSPEEELLHEERVKRWHIMTLIALIGLFVIVYPFFEPVTSASLGFLQVPWRPVFLHMMGAAIVMGALAYGRIMEPFERVMVWTASFTSDYRGALRQFPNGLLLLILSATSLWLGIIGYIVLAIMDDDWPPSTGILFGICAVVNLILSLLLHFHARLPWEWTLIFGGNLPAIAAMVGWWMGSLDAQQYE